MTKPILLTLTAVLAVTISRAGDKEGISDLKYEVPGHYQFLYEGGLVLEAVQPAWDGLPYDSILFARRPGFEGPSYSLTLRRGGSASFKGWTMTREGAWSGRIGVTDYGRLCFILDKLGIADLDSDYSAVWTDARSSLLRVFPAGGAAPISVHEYGGQGPPNLWALHHSVEATSEEVQWTRNK